MNLTVLADTLRGQAEGERCERNGREIVLLDSERQPCEVWTRVMGYHRPVASFNTGKKGEHAERRFFRVGNGPT